MVVGWTVSLGGIFIGWVIYSGKPLGGEAPDPLSIFFGKLYLAMENKFYVDEFYAATVRRLWNLTALLVVILDAILAMTRELFVFSARALSYLFHHLGDRTLIDRWAFDGTCDTLRQTGELATVPQNGFLSGYLRWLTVGALLLAIFSIGGCS